MKSTVSPSTTSTAANSSKTAPGTPETSYLSSNTPDTVSISSTGASTSKTTGSTGASGGAPVLTNETFQVKAGNVQTIPVKGNSLTYTLNGTEYTLNLPPDTLINPGTNASVSPIMPQGGGAYGGVSVTVATGTGTQTFNFGYVRPEFLGVPVGPYQFVYWGKGSNPSD
jgi:hypothetical protein